MAANPPMMADRVINNPYKCKITETWLHWPVKPWSLASTFKLVLFSDFGAAVVWVAKAKAQKIHDVLRPYVEKHMDAIMHSDASWFVLNRPWMAMVFDDSSIRSAFQSFNSINY